VRGTSRERREEFLFELFLLYFTRICFSFSLCISALSLSLSLSLPLSFKFSLSSFFPSFPPFSCLLEMSRFSLQRLSTPLFRSSASARLVSSPLSLSLSSSLSHRNFSSSLSLSQGRVADEVALVTGGAAGIGRETALLLSAQGARGVIVADLDRSQGEETVKMICSLGGKAMFSHCDVSQSEHLERAVAMAEKEYGKLTILFNNAGIMMNDDDDAVKTSEQVLDKTFAVNVKGVFFGCKHGIPALRRAGGGSIINTASFVALMGAATPQLAYTASKGAVLAMSRELAVIHAKENIRVNALCPGPLRTKLLMEFLNTEEKKKRRLVHVPMGRFGEAKEMAQAVLFLASKESSYVTGTEFLVDGGLTSAYVTPL